MSSETAALENVRVLDLSRVLAGPFCTMMLGDLGAEVLKIESPDGGDETRHWGPPWSQKGADRLSAYFLSVNRNKKSITINLKTGKGRELVRQLCRKSQVLVENFRPGKLKEYGLDYAELQKINPALVYCSISGFGQTGAYRDRPGYDYVVQAMSGLMSLTGPVDGTPCKTGVAISDVLTGLFALSSILAALRFSEKTGQGQLIDISLLDCQIASLVNIASGYLVSRKPPVRQGNQHANIVPYQTFEAADGYLVVAVGNDRQFRRLCEVLGLPELSGDEHFATNPSRVENRDELIPLLQARLLQRPVTETVDTLLAAGVPAGPILDIPSILEDRHILDRGLVQEIDGFEMVGPAPRFSQTPPRIRIQPPGLGEHTEQVLRDLVGLDEEAISEYRRTGVV